MITENTLHSGMAASHLAPLLDAVGATSYLNTKLGVPCTTKTLAKLRCVGGGPVFRRFGRLIRYDTNALDVWAQGRLSGPLRSTSDLGWRASTITQNIETRDNTAKSTFT